MAAARILVNAESKRGDGKIDTVLGRGEYLKCATSYAGTVERTSARRESRLDRTRLPRAVQPWPARNSGALDPERISLSKSAQTSTGMFSQKPPQVDNHQSSQEATSHIPESMVSNEETCEADKETDCFLTSLAFSRVIEVTPGGTEYGRGKGGTVVPSMPSTEHGQETVHSLVRQKFGQSQISVVQKRPHQGRGRQVECRRGLRHQPIDRCKTLLLHRADGTPAGSSMLWKFWMRARTDRKESSRSMSKATKALEQSSSALPGGEEDR